MDDASHGRRSAALVFGLLSAVLLLVAVAVSALLLRPHNQLPARGNAPLPIASVKGPAILKLELVWRDEDITAILAPATNDSTHDRAVRERDIADARAGNTYDTLLFVPSYSLLLIALAALAGAVGP